MNRCAFTGCETPLVDPTTGTVVAEVCHIRAQSSGGPRFDANLSEEDRHAYENLILMCKNHHSVIDDTNNLMVFTVEYLTDLKVRHEEDASKNPAPPSVSEAVASAILMNSVVYEEGSSHLDFRDAYFKVGGDGGQMGGSGGAGGVLTIVGTTRRPLGAAIDLNGGHGQFPGGGGGGGGALRFEGRPATAADLEAGLVVRGFFLGDALRIADGLLFSHDAGPAFYRVSGVPSIVRTGFAVIVDYGDLPPATLIKFDVVADSISGNARTEGTLDFEVPDWQNLVPRRCVAANVTMEVIKTGVVNVRLVSGSVTLAEYPVELRAAD